MKLILSFVVVIILLMPVSEFCQEPDWRKLVPLESTREDVEKILGKPVKYFDTEGTYDTKLGKFYVNYSSGECREDYEEIEYLAPAGRLMSFRLKLNKFGLIKDYISDKDKFKRRKYPQDDSRNLYLSEDKSLGVETILLNQTDEYVEAIVVGPGKDKDYLLCKNIKNTK